MRPADAACTFLGFAFTLSLRSYAPYFRACHLMSEVKACHLPYAVNHVLQMHMASDFAVF